MQTTPIRIIVIHDDIDLNSPIIVTLKASYGEDNVILFKHSKEGLQYVLDNKGQKMVVLLDKNFEDKNDISGIKVFEEIKHQTSLIYVVLVTVSKFNEFSDDELKMLINNEIFAIESFASDYSKIIEHIDRAASLFDTRIDCAMEQWILQHAADQLEEPYITTSEGKTYNLKNLLDEIRIRTPFGVDMERKIIALTIDMLARGKKQIDG